MTPVIDLKSKQKDDDEANSNSPKVQSKTFTTSLNVRDFDWNVANEYDPMWPNDYEKVAKGMIKVEKTAKGRNYYVFLKEYKII